MNKMKKFLACILALTMAMALAACGSSGTTETTDSTAEDTEEETTEAASDEVITLTVWGAEEDQDLLEELIAGFEEEYSDYTFDITLGVESESTAKDTVLTDVEAAADVYAFANDQLSELVNAGALAPLSDVEAALEAYAGVTVDDIIAANTESSVSSATLDDVLYAFPMSGGNNYFLYYDTDVISEEDAATWDTLLAAAEAAGGKVGMTLSSGWYNASFFVGAGFSGGENNGDGGTTIDWNGTSSLGYTGVQVVQSMLTIASNASFMAIADGDISNQIASGELVAVISGTWDASAVSEAFGENYSATTLPTYTIGDDQVEMTAVTGTKLVGVNAYSDNVGWAAILAYYITNEEAQEARAIARQSIPTNLSAAEDEDVIASNTAANAASAAQDANAYIQDVGSNYWDPTSTFGENIAQGTWSVDDEDTIQEALDTLVESVAAASE